MLAEGIGPAALRRLSTGPEAGLLHERQYVGAEELKVWEVVVEVDLHAIAAGLVEPDQGVYDLRGRPYH